MTKQTVYITKFWKTRGIIVTEGQIEQLPSGVQYVTAEMTAPHNGQPFTDCFGSNANEFWLSEEEAMNYVRQQQDKEFAQTRSSLWGLLELCDEEAKLPVGRLVSLFDDLVPAFRKLPTVVRQGNVSEGENNNETHNKHYF